MGDTILQYPQRTDFLTPEELESAYKIRLDKMTYLLSTPEGMAELEQYVKSQVDERGIHPEEADIDLNHNWLRNTFNKNDREFARQITMSTTLFKAIDAEKNGGRIIRLSPHVKTASECFKFGFAFFPRNEELTEPWVGNYVANLDGSFTINLHKNERSSEEAGRLEKLAKAKVERQRKAREDAEAKAERQRKAREEAPVRAKSKAERQLRVQGKAEVELAEAKAERRRAARAKSKAERQLGVQGKAEVAAEAEFREQEAPRPSTSIREEVRRVPIVGEGESQIPTEEFSAERSGDPSFVQKLKKDKEEEKRDSGRSLD